MQIRHTIIAVLLIFISFSCREELDVSVTEKVIQNDFEISETTYGGIIGQAEISYSFKRENDSVQIHIIHHFMSPKEEFKIKVGMSTFNEMKSQIICLSNMHINSEAKPRGCQPPFESEYIIESRFSKIRIYPMNQDTCQFSLTLPKYKPERNLLN